MSPTMTATFRKQVQRSLYWLTRKVATALPDIGRQRFIQEMIVGVVVSRKVHST